MRRLMQYLKPYRWRVVLALAFVAVVTPLELAPPLLFWKVIDKYFTPALNGTIPVSQAWRGVAWVSGFFLTVLTFAFLLQYVRLRISYSVWPSTIYAIHLQTSGHLPRLPTNK